MKMNAKEITNKSHVFINSRYSATVPITLRYDVLSEKEERLR